MGTLGAKTSQWHPLQVTPMACALLAIPQIRHFLDLMLRYCRRKSGVLQAFVQTLFTWLLCVKSFLAVFSYSSGLPWRVQLHLIGFLYRATDMTLHLSGWIKIHFLTYISYDILYVENTSMATSLCLWFYCFQIVFKYLTFQSFDFEVPDEGYSRIALCALNLRSTGFFLFFFFIKPVIFY